MKYEYTEGRHIMLSDDKSKWLKCFECGKSSKSVKVTTCKKDICLSCYFKDKEGKLE